MTMPGDVETRHYNAYRDAGGKLTKFAVVHEESGSPLNLFDENSTIPDVGIIVITYTAIEPLRLINARVSCFIEGKMSVLVNGIKIGTSRTSPGRPDTEINYQPYLNLSSGDVVEVEFKARPNSPISEVEAHITAFTKTIL